jgi:hypothetical protein
VTVGQAEEKRSGNYAELGQETHPRTETNVVDWRVSCCYRSNRQGTNTRNVVVPFLM